MDVEQEKLPLTNAKMSTTQNTMEVEEEKLPLTNATETTILEDLFIFILPVLICMIMGTLLYKLYSVLTEEGRHPEFNIKDLTVSSLNIRDGEINANFTITFNIYNPKKGSEILYHEPTVSIFYMDQSLSTSKITTFHQKAGQRSSMNAILTASPARVGTSLAHSINYDQTWEKSVRFVVQVESDLTVNPGTSFETKIDMTVTCWHIEVVFPSNGKFGKFSPGHEWCTFK